MMAWILKLPALIRSVVIHAQQVTVAFTVQSLAVACKWTFFNLNKLLVSSTYRSNGFESCFVFYHLVRKDANKSLPIVVMSTARVVETLARAGVEWVETEVETSGVTTIAWEIDEITLGGDRGNG